MWQDTERQCKRGLSACNMQEVEVNFHNVCHAQKRELSTMLPGLDGTDMAVRYSLVH